MQSLWGKLPNLRLLILQNNNLNGSVPSSLFSSASLDAMYLQGNALSGTLPSMQGDYLMYGLFLKTDSCGAVLAVGLLDNMVSCLCLQIGWHGASIYCNPINLWALAGPHCKLTTCCAAAGNLSGLRYVDFSSNMLSGCILQDLCTLANVTELSLATNHFTGMQFPLC